MDISSDDIAKLHAQMPIGTEFSMAVPMIGDPEVKIRQFTVIEHTPHGLKFRIAGG